MRVMGAKKQASVFVLRSIELWQCVYDKIAFTFSETGTFTVPHSQS